MQNSLDEPYEVHLTVELNGQDASALGAFAKARGCRFLHLLLGAGAFPSQPMLSWRQAGGVDSALDRSSAIADDLDRLGMKLVRIKVEADVGFLSDRPTKYYEAHFKIELCEARVVELEHLARGLGAHLSRSARSRAADKEQRFLTARHEAQVAARELFDRVEAALRAEHWLLLDVRKEAVVYDSNLALDAGWST